MTDRIVKKLTAAATAYYETGSPIMSDQDYDHMIEELRQLDPKNMFLTQIGPRPSKEAVELPYPMPSLRKVKPDSLSSWRVRGPFVISEKLDGVSAMWIPAQKKLYLRGDGSVGQDISHYVPYIKGLMNSDLTAVRGELISPKDVSKIARNWVNGIIHQKGAAKSDLAKIQFVAYQVISPRLTRSNQFKIMNEKGYLTADSKVVDALTVEQLSAMFMERRTNSIYECDGLVIGQDKVYEELSINEPKDCIAFKMAIDDQRGESTVIAVEWNSSKGGLWIPRVNFKPVKIGSAMIEWATGINADNIWTQRIGPGAKILVRRSGDVIPLIEKVLGGVEPQMPEKGRWAWDSGHVNALDTTTELTDEKYAQAIANLCSTFGIDGYSEKNILKVVKAGFKTCPDILRANERDLVVAIGPTLGPRLTERLLNGISNASPEQWIHAWTGWSRGFGTTRIKAFLAVKPNVRDWINCTVIPEGMSTNSVNQVKECVPAYLAWRATFSAWTPSVSTAPVTVPSTTASPAKTKGHIVFTGFRDTGLEEELTKRGWINEKTITKKTNYLIVSDISEKETTKTAKAKAAGITILGRTDVLDHLK
jgi:NAD-dependent DNA ligase